MNVQDVQRKLTTILAADVVGYSRLMGTDEAGTLASLRARRKELLEPKSRQYNGRTVKLMGDGVLMEFSSVVDAVLFAVEVQSAMQRWNTKVAEDRRIVYRIGINIGDIIVEGADIYGDGVNIASRLESLAEPGGICIARNVFNQVKGKLDLNFIHLGEREIKNIAEAISVYRVAVDEKADALATQIQLHKPRPLKQSALIVATMVFVLAIGGLAWWQPWAPDVEPVAVDRMKLPLPDKPSIAVLPFANMSGDATQDYLADGITENIITTLAQVSGMFVIARNSTFVYKGTPVNVQEVAETLGVQYVLEGSFQRADQTVRITAQLIDALSGNHVWAEKFDQQLEGIFELQDSISRSIVTAMKVELTEGESGRIFRTQTESPEAFETFMRAVELFRRFNNDDLAEARKLFERAVELDPEYATAWSMLGFTYFADAAWFDAENPELLVARAEELVRKALEFDRFNATAYAQLGQIVHYQGRHEEGIALRQKALELEPNLDGVRAQLAESLNYVGRPKEALVLIEEAMRLNPMFPAWFWWVVGDAHRMMGNYEEAIAAFENQRKGMPKSYFGYWNLAITYAQAGRLDEARAAAVHVLKALPNFSVREHEKTSPYKDPSETKRISEALLKAGLPE